MDSLVPIISAGVGGALAILGAYINSLTSHRRQSNAERRSRTANKLEDAARLANSIKKSGIRIRVRALGIPVGAKEPPPDDGIKESVSDELILLLRLYEPKILPSAQALVDAERAVGEAAVRQLSEWAFNDEPTSENYEKFANESEELISQLEHLYEIFIKELAARFLDYRL